MVAWDAKHEIVFVLITENSCVKNLKIKAYLEIRCFIPETTDLYYKMI